MNMILLTAIHPKEDYGIYCQFYGKSIVTKPNTGWYWG